MVTENVLFHFSFNIDSSFQKTVDIAGKSLHETLSVDLFGRKQWLGIIKLFCILLERTQMSCKCTIK